MSTSYFVPLINYMHGKPILCPFSLRYRQNIFQISSTFFATIIFFMCYVLVVSRYMLVVNCYVLVVNCYILVVILSQHNIYLTLLLLFHLNFRQFHLRPSVLQKPAQYPPTITPQTTDIFPDSCTCLKL